MFLVGICIIRFTLSPNKSTGWPFIAPYSMFIHTISFSLQKAYTKILGWFPFRGLNNRFFWNSRKIHVLTSVSFTYNLYGINCIGVTVDSIVVNFLNTVYTNWKVSLKLPFINIQTSFVLYAHHQIGLGQRFDLYTPCLKKSIQSKLKNTIQFL